ncbi:hypothetical protein ACHAWF_010126, partial [Thalassiosira exigua]
GVRADTIDAFVNLVEWGGVEVQPLRQTFCDLIHQGIIPAEVQKFFSNTYIFCLYKDPGNPRKLQPIGVPTFLCRIVASHIIQYNQEQFARDLLPHNFAIGVKGDVNFVIKVAQLAAERYIELPELCGDCPSRGIMHFDFENMFNDMSREEAMDILREEYPELVVVCSLLYGDGTSAYYNWEDSTWRSISIWEGLNQEDCPLSGSLAALVMGRIMRPVDELLRARAAVWLADRDPANDGHNGITHFMGWVDDTTAAILLEDIRFCCSKIREFSRPRGRKCNVLKGRLQTSCLGRAIDPIMRPRNPALADDIAWTIREFLCKAGRLNTNMSCKTA